MNYEEYVKCQTVTHGMLKKPRHYRISQKRAIDSFFMPFLHRDHSILDIGCGDGTGVKYLLSMGFTDVMGIELSPIKAKFSNRKGYNVVQGDFLTYDFHKIFDIIWMSHSLEHMLYPDKVIEKIIEITTTSPNIFIIVPYPDTGPNDAHCASTQMGTRRKDDGKTFMKWLKDLGLDVYAHKFDNYREPEIWIWATK